MTKDSIGISLAGADRSHPYFRAAFIQSGDWRGMDGKAATVK